MARMKRDMNSLGLGYKTPRAIPPFFDPADYYTEYPTAGVYLTKYWVYGPGSICSTRNQGNGNEAHLLNRIL